MGDDALPDNLKGTKHWDYPKFLRWIPRAWTSYAWGAPKKIVGDQKETRKGKEGNSGPAPIGERGSWQVSRFPGAPGPLKYLPLYVAFTTKSGRHFRIGARWDDVDNYVTFPTVASRKYEGGDGQDTSTL
jgi:hypothetical protein